MNKTLIHININDYPKELHPYFNYNNIYDSSCSKNATVLYIDTGFYLKISEKGNLREEYLNTKWFNKIGLGVQVVKYLSLDKDYLLTTEAKGLDGTHYLNDPKKLCEIYAYTLKKIHNTNYESYINNNKMEKYLEFAMANYNLGKYEDYVLLKRFNINSKEEVIEYIKNNVHKLKSDTLIHGDYCLPNIVIDENNNVTLIDLDHSGIGDKHIDLFWAIWSLSFNLKTEEYNDYFLELYGNDNYDESILKLIACIETLG